MPAVHVIRICNEIVREAAKTFMWCRSLASSWCNNLKRMTLGSSQNRQAPTINSKMLKNI